MFSSEYIIKAFNMLENEHSKLKRTEAERHAEILGKFPEYGELEEQLAQTARDIVSVVINGRIEDRYEVLEKIKSKNLSIQKKMTDILVNNGYDEDYLKPLFYCDICSDKGAVNGEWCSCIKRAAIKFAAADLNENGSLCTFDDFDLSFYSDKYSEKCDCVPRETMKKNLEDCKRFVEKFNGTGSGIFMIGATGLGKTHLSLAIANELIKKGWSVVYNSVPELLRKLNSEQFGNSDGDTMRIITDCDLLILDDLGAEHNTEYSSSVVYQLLNARVAHNRPMVVSTNLEMGEIKSRYQDRIWSRLFSMRVLLFYGTDNRLRTAGNNW